MARSENLTIMFTDVVGYTQRTSAQSRAQNQAMLARCDRLLLPLARRFGGWHVKSIGDALLIAFRSPTDAVRCGMAMQDALADSNRTLPEPQRLHIRVALNVGEVLVEVGDVFGEAVNVAARVEQIAPADAIWFTEAVYLAMNKAEVPSQVVGTEILKGIPDPVKIYTVPPGRITRLVASGESLDQTPDELPYGGMHRHRADVPLPLRMKNQLRRAQFATVQAATGAWQAARSPTQSWQRLRGSFATRRGAWIVSAAMLASLAAGLVLWEAKPLAEAPSAAPPAADVRTYRLLAEAEPLLVAQQYVKLRELAEGKLAQEPGNAEALLLRGHALYGQAARREALADYEKALALGPSLRDDIRLAMNLVNSLGRQTAAAATLIAKYPAPMMVQALEQRGAQAGALGRAKAVELLDGMGEGSRVDRVAVAILDLREGETCENRKAAVSRLRRLRDPRALPELKVVSEGVGNWFKNACLRDEAKAAIAEIKPR